MTLVRKGDTHRELIVKYWGKYTPEIDRRISRLNHLNKNRTIGEGKKYLYTPDEVKNAEQATIKREEAARKSKEEEERLNKLGLKKVTDIIDKFNDNPSGIPEYTDSFIFPLEGNRITSDFGDRKDPIGKKVKTKNKKGKTKWKTKHSTQFHNGIDIGGGRGTNIPAANDGVVVYAGPFRGYGNIVVLAHQNGNDRYYTLYAHNDELLVKEGDLVNRGQTISKMGSSGRSTGPHLHFELIAANGERIDPTMITKIEIHNSDNIASNIPNEKKTLKASQEILLINDQVDYHQHLKNQLDIKILKDIPEYTRPVGDQEQVKQKSIFDLLV